jgi:hypothetical protein
VCVGVVGGGRGRACGWLVGWLAGWLVSRLVRAGLLVLQLGRGSQTTPAAAMVWLPVGVCDHGALRGKRGSLTTHQLPTSSSPGWPPQSKPSIEMTSTPCVSASQHEPASVSARERA